jgi:hypothetical protein
VTLQSFEVLVQHLQPSRVVTAEDIIKQVTAFKAKSRGQYRFDNDDDLERFMDFAANGLQLSKVRAFVVDLRDLMPKLSSLDNVESRLVISVAKKYEASMAKSMGESCELAVKQVRDTAMTGHVFCSVGSAYHSLLLSDLNPILTPGLCF